MKLLKSTLSGMVPRHVLCLSVCLLLTVTACKKDLFTRNSLTTDAADAGAVKRFLAIPVNAGKELRAIAADLQVMEERTQFISRFSAINGFPKWEATISSKPLLSNADNNGSKKTNTVQQDTASAAPIYFIPLVDTATDEIRSFIFCAKTGDSAYRYQVYNKAALQHKIPKTVDNFNNGTLLMGVFAVFENSMHDVKRTKYGFPYTHEYVDAKISFDAVSVQMDKRVNGKANPTKAASSSSNPVQVNCTWIPKFATIYIFGVPVGMHWLHNICSGENVFQFFYSVVMNMQGDEGGSGGSATSGSSSGSFNGGIFIGGSNLYSYSGYNPYSGAPTFYSTGGGGGQVYAGSDPIPPGDDEDPAWGVVQVPQVEDPYAPYQVFAALDNDRTFEESVDDSGTDVTGSDNTDYGQYNGNQSWPTVLPVQGTADYVGWGYPGVRKNCLDYAKAQIAKLGHAITGYGVSGQYFQLRTSSGVNATEARKSVAYIQAALQQGKPVIVGVDYHAGSPNADGVTDHFVVIVGSGTAPDGRHYFLFHDNAANYKNAKEGASEGNRLYWNEQNATLEGTSDAMYYGATAKQYYQVTQVRKTRTP